MRKKTKRHVYCVNCHWRPVENTIYCFPTCDDDFFAPNHRIRSEMAELNKNNDCEYHLSTTIKLKEQP